MLSNNPLVGENLPNYNAEWRVVFNRTWGEDHTKWIEYLNTTFYSPLTAEIDKIWDEERMTTKDKILRDKFMEFLRKRTIQVYPNAHLICSGSSISTCGTASADMDLCFAYKTSDKPTGPHGLPIERFNEMEINSFMIDRLYAVLVGYPEITGFEVRGARVPIVKFNINANVVDPNEESKNFEFDVNCNCVAGVYNAYLLGGLANFDDRPQKLSIIIKQWAKKVRVVDPNRGRFNSYMIVLLIVHYLQCGVNPPVLPNLMKLLPEDFDGNKDPWDLTTKLDFSRLPKPTNRMSVGALLCGFFRYYAQFDFVNYGISIKEAAMFELRPHQPLAGQLHSMIYFEEPYDGLTVPKNVDKQSDFNHIRFEFQIANYFMNKKTIEKKPCLEPLFSRENIPECATREEDVEMIQNGEL